MLKKMRWLNIFILTVFLVTIVMGNYSTAYAAKVTDTKGHWAEVPITEMVNKGIISGYPDDLFKPNEKITRAEFACLIVEGFNLSKGGGKIFADTAEHWAKDSIAIANAYGILNGYSDNMCGPNDPITREQMAVMIVKAVNLNNNGTSKTFTDSQNISVWAKDSVGIATGKNIITGYPDNTFRPRGYTTRAEAAVVLSKSLAISLPLVEPIEQNYSVIETAGTYGPTTGTKIITSNVTVKVKDVTLQNLIIEGDLIIAQEVGDGDVILNNINVKGKTYIRGGGKDSIHINGGQYNEIIIEQTATGSVRIVAVNKQGVVVTIAENATGEEIILQGYIKSVTVKADDVTITSRPGTKIEEIKVESGLKDINIDLEKNSTVKEMILESPTTVKENGVITQTSGSKVTESTFIRPETTSGGGGGGSSSTGAVSAINIATDVDVSGGVDNDAVVEVTLTTETSGADIYYTTDGSTPTASSTKYTVPFNLQANDTAGKTITVKAIGIKLGYTNSSVAAKKIVFKSASISVTSVSLNKSTLELVAGGNETLIATITPADASNKNVVWSLDNSTVATVDLTGKVTAVATGTATITALTVDGNYTATCVVNVTPSDFAGGDGTSGNPYQIETAQQLNSVRNYIDKHYILMDDIDLSAYASWVPIGNVYASQFYGSFDGNGHTISNLKITSSDGLRMFGLFGYVTDATIKNLQIKDAYVVPSSSYEQQVGILAGYTARATISNCSTSGTVGGGATYLLSFHVGGLVGQISNETVVDSCYSVVNVISSGSGLIDDAQPGTTIKNSYSSGTVSNGAGFVGNIGATVENCYTMATVNNGNLFASYISDNDDVTSCYYQNVAEGPVPVGSGSITGIIGVDEAAMKNQATFIGWDFDTIWGINSVDNNGYPFLRWQGY